MRLAGTSRADAPGGVPRAAPPDISLVGAPAAIIDDGGRILEANREFEELTGLACRELKGTPVCSLLRESAITGAGASKGRARLPSPDGRGASVAYSVRPAPGTGARVLTAFPLAEEDRLRAELEARTDELGKRERYLECFRDGVFRMISDLDRSETELRDALRNLQETKVQLIQSSKMTALGELSASLVHEISQPLTVIRGLTHGMLRTMEEGSPCREKMRLIGEASSRMEKLVKHLKSFSRSELPVFSPLDLNGVVRDAFLILSEHLLSRSIETVIDLGPLPPVMGNPNRLEQVIINLVTNARDAMPGGGVITVSTGVVEDASARCVRLSVSDTGGGIPEEITGRVFDPFFTTKETGKGTGLGLSISLGIVREHRGEMRFESGKGGTTFHVLLPAPAPVEGQGGL